MTTLKIESPRFGTLVVDASRIIEFSGGLQHAFPRSPAKSPLPESLP